MEQGNTGCWILNIDFGLIAERERNAANGVRGMSSSVTGRRPASKGVPNASSTQQIGGGNGDFPFNEDDNTTMDEQSAGSTEWLSDLVERLDIVRERLADLKEVPSLYWWIPWMPWGVPNNRSVLVLWVQVNWTLNGWPLMVVVDDISKPHKPHHHHKEHEESWLGEEIADSKGEREEENEE